MKRMSFLIIVLFFTFIIFNTPIEMQENVSEVVSGNTIKSGNMDLVKAAGKNSIKKVTIFVCGDIMFHMGEVQSAKTKNGYDFNPFFSEIKGEIGKSDIAVGNFESTVDPGKKPSGYPAFNTPVESLKALSSSGFDVLVASNNHSLDTGISGLLNTKKEIEKNKMKCAGIGNNKDVIVERNGIKVGIMAYTYSTNLGKKYSNYLNYIDINKIQSDIKNIRSKCDFLIVYLHIGNEYNRVPEKYQLDIVNNVAKYGADAILCSHPHVARKSQIIKVGGKDVFVNYSMGNFISNQDKLYTDIGTISELTLEKSGNSTYVSKAETRTVYRLKFVNGIANFKTILADNIDKYKKYITYSKLQYIKGTASQYKFLYVKK